MRKRNIGSDLFSWMSAWSSFVIKGAHIGEKMEGASDSKVRENHKSGVKSAREVAGDEFNPRSKQYFLEEPPPVSVLSLYHVA